MSASRLQHYIYKITNKTTGEYYIGKRTCVDWRTDDYMGSGFLLNRKMKAHPDHEWTKEVLLLLSSEEQAYEYEAVAVGNRYYTDPLCLNLIAGGDGGFASRAMMEERERRMADWLDGEKLPDVTLIYMSNDKTKTRVGFGNDTNICKEIVRTLIKQGYYFGCVNAYKRVSMSELGWANISTREEISSLINSGVYPDKRAIRLMNHELKTYVFVAKSKNAILIINDLLSRGWVIGACNAYRRIALSEVSNFSKPVEGIHNDHESRYLQGLPCLTCSVYMTSPCKTKYVSIKSKKNHPYPKRVKEFYNFGWTFECKAGAIKVNIKGLSYQDTGRLSCN